MPLALPSEVRNLAVAGGVRNLTLSWQPPLDTGGVAILRYIVYRGDAADGLVKLTELPGDAASFKDEGVVVGHTYYYAVVAVTVAGEGPRGLVASGMAIEWPGQPQGFAATAGDGKVTLNWSAPASDGASPITGYIVMRGSSTISLAELAQLGVLTSFVDTAVTNGQTYYYAVVAQNGAGRGEPCPPVSAKPAKPIVAPGKVANLIFSVKDGKVTLQWTAPASDGGSPIIGYVVLRGTSPGNMTLLTELGTVTSHTDATAKRGTTYYYTVVAKNAVGRGEPFAAQEVKVPKAAKKSPGLEAPAALLAIAGVALVALNIQRRRRGAA
jgi:fibronectin type 3 domain-containing protein